VYGISQSVNLLAARVCLVEWKCVLLVRRTRIYNYWPWLTRTALTLTACVRSLISGQILWRKHSGPVRTSVTFQRSTFLTWPAY